MILAQVRKVQSFCQCTPSLLGATSSSCVPWSALSLQAVQSHSSKRCAYAWRSVRVRGGAGRHSRQGRPCSRVHSPRHQPCRPGHASQRWACSNPNPSRKSPACGQFRSARAVWHGRAEWPRWGGGSARSTEGGPESARQACATALPGLHNIIKCVHAAAFGQRLSGSTVTTKVHVFV